MRLLISACVAVVACNGTPPVGPWQSLQQRIDTITRAVPAKWGVYIKCLETGEEAAVNADAAMDTMSVIKVPLMVEVFRQMEAGRFAPGDRVALVDDARRPGSGVMRMLDAGDSFTIRDLIVMMIVISDNTATDLLYDKVGGIGPVNALMQQYGLTGIRATGTTREWFDSLAHATSAEQFHREDKVHFGLASARDTGRLLEKIVRGEAVSPGASAAMLQVLRNQQHTSRLPKHVMTFNIAHKAGDFAPFVANDVGVFERDGRHVVVAVFTEQYFGRKGEVDDAIGRIGEEVARYFEPR